MFYSVSCRAIYREQWYRARLVCGGGDGGHISRNNVDKSHNRNSWQISPEGGEDTGAKSLVKSWLPDTVG